MEKFCLTYGFRSRRIFLLAGLFAGLIGWLILASLPGGDVPAQAATEAQASDQAGTDTKTQLTITLASVGAAADPRRADIVSYGIETTPIVESNSKLTQETKIATPTEAVNPTPADVASRGERPSSETPTTTAASATPAPTVIPTPTAIPKPKLAGKRIGIQAGHWQTEQLPAEFASLRTSTGALAAGVHEVDLNLKVARMVAAILQQQGAQVDVIPSTVPVQYQADAFVAIHADANNSSTPHGFKASRSNRSAIAAVDDALVNAIYAEYLPASGMPRNDNAITSAMLYYYAFAGGSASHAVAPSTPAAIVEMGYLTNPSDRDFMLNKTEIVANAIAQGIIRFLTSR